MIEKFAPFERRRGTNNRCDAKRGYRYVAAEALSRVVKGLFYSLSNWFTYIVILRVLVRCGTMSYDVFERFRMFLAVPC